MGICVFELCSMEDLMHKTPRWLCRKCVHYDVSDNCWSSCVVSCHNRKLHFLYVSLDCSRCHGLACLYRDFDSLGLVRYWDAWEVVAYSIRLRSYWSIARTFLGCCTNTYFRCCAVAVNVTNCQGGGELGVTSFFDLPQPPSRATFEGPAELHGHLIDPSGVAKATRSELALSFLTTSLGLFSCTTGPFSC